MRVTGCIILQNNGLVSVIEYTPLIQLILSALKIGDDFLSVVVMYAPDISLLSAGIRAIELFAISDDKVKIILIREK